ncbi:MAG: serine/threonine protein kinase [Myxococcota bacterium]|nr:serine/threonine protein kinase [Myxococcota bacterium]
MQSGLHAAAGVREGDVIAGKYRIDRILGAGAMGVVVAAHHAQLDTKVAIKFLLPSMLANQEAVRRFAREARAAVKITSEHVARVFDVGILETGAPYIVMEFLDGVDLANWLQGQGPLPIEQGVDFVLQALVAVAEAHGLGIVHRDLKPSNLFCIRRADGQLSVKVLDFGISKLVGAGATSSDMAATKTSSVMGSPLYMSPEQMQSSRDVDSRTDIWAIGVILFELLTGKVPFGGDTLPEVCTKIALQPPPSLRSFRPSIPAALDAAILKCLEKAPAKRYQNVAELALELLEFGSKRAKASVERISGIIQASGLSASALALPPSSEPTGDAGSAGSIAPFGKTTSGRGRSRAAFAVMAVVGVAVTLAGVMGIRSLLRVTEAKRSSAEGAVSSARVPETVNVLADKAVLSAPIVLAPPAAPDLSSTELPKQAIPTVATSTSVRAVSGMHLPTVASATAVPPFIPNTNFARPAPSAAHDSLEELIRGAPPKDDPAPSTSRVPTTSPPPPPSRSRPSTRNALDLPLQ